MKYYITGKGGFIGREVVKFVGSDNVINDVENGCTVINLAAYGNHYHQKDRHKIATANVSDLITLIDYSLAIGVEKFYNISTSSVTLKKQTMYSASKLFGETIINSINDDRFVNVRPYSVYGIGEASWRFIPVVIDSLLTGSEMVIDKYAKHDWIYVSDFVKAMFDGHTEIGCGVNYSNIEIVNMLEDISGKKLKYTEAKLRSYDNEEWVCPHKNIQHIDIYEGLKMTYDSINNATQQNN